MHLRRRRKIHPCVTFVYMYISGKETQHIPLQLLQPCYRLGFYRKIQTILWDYAGSSVRLGFYGKIQTILWEYAGSRVRLGFYGKIQTILWDYAGSVVQDAGFQPCTECLYP